MAANPMVVDLLDRLHEETLQAIAYKDSDNNDDKVPVKDQVMGIFGKNGATVLKDEDFKAYGLTAKQTETLRSLCSVVRQSFVSKYGESVGFDSKRGTSIVNSLKSLAAMADLGTFDLTPEDLSAIKDGTDEWYANAPLRGIAGAKRKAMETGKNDAENEAAA